MPQTSLSETLFKSHFKHPETSTLVRRLSTGKPQAMQSALSGNHVDHWYRLINRLMWVWRGVTPRGILDIQARIVMSEAERTDPELFDTVIGYRGGDQIFEQTKEAMQWQQRAGQEADPLLSGRHWLHASNLYGIAAYPHIKGDGLAEQAQVLANQAYEEAAQRLSDSLRELGFTIPSGSPITGFLHMPKGDGPFPTVLMCGGLDSLQTDYHNLYENYFSPLGIAMLTIDMPSIGFPSKWTLNQDTSLLHQHALCHLENVPWVDYTRVTAFGLRFGANIAIRLGYLGPQWLKVVAHLGPVVHGLLVDPLHQGCVPKMYLDMLASRLGMHDVSDGALRVELNHYSLKAQGLLGRRYPVPMLSGFWKDDPFSPEEESRLITSSSAGGKLLEIPFNPVCRNLGHALRQIARWINHRFG